MPASSKKSKRGAAPTKLEGKIAKPQKGQHIASNLAGCANAYQESSRSSHRDELEELIASTSDQKFVSQDNCLSSWSQDSCLQEEDESRNKDVYMDDDHQSAADTEDQHEAATQSEAVRLPALDRALIGMHEVLALGVPGLVNYQRAQMALCSVLSTAPFNQFGMQVNVDDYTLSERSCEEGGPSLVQQILTLESRSSVKKGQWVPRPCQYFSREQWKKLGIIPNHPHSGSPLALKITRFEREKVSVIGVLWNRVAGDARAVLALLREWSHHFDAEYAPDPTAYTSRADVCARESDLMVGEHFLKPDAELQTDLVATPSSDDGSAASTVSLTASLPEEAAESGAFPLPLVPSEAVDEMLEAMDDDEEVCAMAQVEFRVAADGLQKWKEEKQLTDVPDDVVVAGLCWAGLLGGAAAAERPAALKLTTAADIRGRCAQVAANLVGNAVAFHGMEVATVEGDVSEAQMLEAVRGYHAHLGAFLAGGGAVFEHTMGRLVRYMSRGEEEGLRLWPSFLKLATDPASVHIESWCGVEVFETQPSGWDFGTGKEVSHLGWPDYGCPRGLRVMPNFRSGKDLALLVGMPQQEVDCLEEFVKRMELPMKLVKQ